MNNIEDFTKVFSQNSINLNLLGKALKAWSLENYCANLSKDKFVGDIVYFDNGETKILSSFQDLKPPFTFTGFHKWWADSMILSNSALYRKFNSIEYLLNEYSLGNTKIDFIYNTQLLDGSFSNVRQVSYLTKADNSDDILMFTMLMPIPDRQLKDADFKFNKSLIQTLSSDFEAVFYADLKNDTISTIRLTPEFQRRNQKINDVVVYSAFCKYFVSNILRDDYESTLLALNKKNVYREFYSKNIFSINYRIPDDEGVNSHYQIKLVKTQEWESRNSFILGIHNIDEENKKNLEQLERVQRQTELNLQLNAVINTMSDDYTSIFYIEFDKDRVFEYRTSSFYRRMQPISSDLYVSIPKFMDILRHITLSKIDPDNQEKILKLLSASKIKATLANNPFYYYDFKINMPEGETWYQMKIVRDTRFHNELNVVLGYRNIDKQRRKEIEQQQALEEAKIKAEAANKAKSTFLFNMSHDIRTPMNAIIGYSSMAEKYLQDPEKVQDCLEKVKMSSEHLLKLINDVLDMARIENGKITLEEKPINLRESINKIVEMESVNASMNQLDLDVTFKNLENEFVIADEFRLSQIFLNIVGNSLKYTKAGGKIHITISELPSKDSGSAAYEFIIEDTGIGMKQEFISHIFEMFSRERNMTDTGIQGTGLGMAIVKNLVDLMGGTINIESQVDKGTKVTFHFNFKIQNQQQIKQTTGPVKKKSKINLKNKRVLLVEDNELNREIARDILEDEGLIVDEAVNGAVAISQVQKSENNPYDFILMDVQMPYMDGYEATRLIRKMKNKNLANLPIIAMTANAFEEDKKRALESGMNAHLSKPIHRDVLFETISQFFG
ncbi:hybrid sensor histidine kinase/response regulator [Treponema sp. JC4]|uniref:hybrid sensor histidine kinase/response regulator n=1 Tax=Treponema sp. JC4 TaxID=1124982 RepID=UPI00030DA217|nr:ATP-binding protein [Treponema sp. JC4]